MNGRLTCNFLCITGAFAPRDENDISLAGAGVFTFQEEEFVDAVVLQGRDLDDEANRAGEALFNHEIFLAADLGAPSHQSIGSRTAKSA